MLLVVVEKVPVLARRESRRGVRKEWPGEGKERRWGEEGGS